MPDIRSFFGGGGGGGAKPPAASANKPSAASPPSPAKRKQSAASKDKTPSTSSGSSGSRARSRKADDDEEAADERKDAPKKAGKVKVTDGKAGERRASAAAGGKKESSKRSSYYEHFDDDDDNDDVFVEYQRTPTSRRAASKAKQSRADDGGEDGEHEEWQDDSASTASKRSASRAKKSPAKATRSTRNKHAAGDEDDEFIDDERDEDEYGDDEQPIRKRGKKGGADASRKKRKNVLVDDDEQMDDQAGAEDGGAAVEEAKAEDEKSTITKHFGSTVSQKQRLKDEKEKSDKLRAEDDKRRAEKEAKAAAEREKDRKAQAVKDKRRMGVVDEETAMKELEGGRPDTSVPANATSQRLTVRKAEIDPDEFFSNPTAAKAKLSAKDRAHGPKRVDVVDLDDMEDDVPLETAASIKQKAADKQRKQEEDSLLLARKLQEEEDKRATRPPPAAAPAASPKRPAAAANGKKATPTKRVKRDDDDGDEEASSAKKRKTATPVKQAGTVKKESEVKKEVKKEDKKSTPAASKATKKEADDDNQDPSAEVKPEKKNLARQAMDNRPATLGMVKDVPEGEEGCLLGLAFVISGVLDSLDRDAAQTLIERYGGRLTSAVSGKTDYLLFGQDPGESKKRKAEELKTKMIDEDGLFDLIRTRKGKSLSADQALKAKAAAAKTKKAASASQQSAVGVTAAVNAATSKGQEQLRVHGKAAERAEDMLWVDKHRPLQLSEIIGNPGLVKRIADFLTNWDAVHLHSGKPDKDAKKAILISGAPGLGKSTSASLVAHEKGFQVIEFNASDVRNKASLEAVVGHLITNHGINEYYTTPAGSSSSSSSSSSKGKPARGRKTVLVMDEVDGIAGNEDRGGLQQLVALIKRSQIPIICIANDTSTQKMKTLKNYTQLLTWKRPTTDQIVPRLTAIATAEGLSVDVNAMRKLIESTQADIRQCINFLQMYRKTHSRLTFDTVLHNSEAGGGKDFDVGVFEVIPAFFRDPGKKAGWIDARSDSYFVDSSLVPLFVQDLYLRAKARLAGGGGVRRPNLSAEKAVKLVECDAMDVVSQAADYIGGADMLSSAIYQEQDYTFMPVHAILSSVAPGYLMSGGGVQGGMSFPTWFGQNSSRMKRQRLIRDMKMAMSLTAPASYADYVTEYLPALRTALIDPFRLQASDDAATAVCATLDQLGLTRDDWDALVEVTDVLAPPKDKAALDTADKRRFTAEWKRTDHKLTVRRGELKAERGAGGGGGMRVGANELEEEEEAAAGGDEEGAEDEDEDEGKEKQAVKKDPMILEAKNESAGKGKGRGKAGARGGAAGRGGRGRGRGGAAAGGKATASKGAKGKNGRGGSSSKKKGGKEERSEDEDEDMDDDMADFIDDDE